jgi:hypothetical protein
MRKSRGIKGESGLFGKLAGLEQQWSDSLRIPFKQSSSLEQV